MAGSRLTSRTYIPNRRIVIREPVVESWHLLLVLLGIAVLVCRILLDGHPGKVEFGYSRPFHPYIAQGLGRLPDLVPATISLTEAAAGIVLFAVPVGILYSFLTARHEGRSMGKWVLRILCHLFASGAGIYVFYMAFWGFNYLRQPFFTALVPHPPFEAPADSDYRKLGEEMAALANRLYRPLHLFPPEARDRRLLDRTLDREVGKIVAITDPSLRAEPPPTKHLHANTLLSIFGISGFFSPFFMEPHVNAELFPWERPCVAAHEKAHFLGFASETDANLIAYVACIGAESEFLRYSAAVRVLLALRPHISPLVWHDLFTVKLSPEVRGAVEARNRSIRQYRERFPRLFSLRRKINHAYLKLNSQTLGMASYGAALPQFAVWWKETRSRRGIDSIGPALAGQW